MPIPTNTYNNNLPYSPDFSTSQNIDDAIIAIFQRITDNKNSAKSLAAAVIMTCTAQGINPMSTMTEFSNMESTQLSQYLTMFLNLSRVGTSFLGINNRPVASKYITRMIKA